MGAPALVRATYTEADLEPLALAEVGIRGGDDSDVERCLTNIKLAADYGGLYRFVHGGEPVGFVAAIRTSPEIAYESAEKGRKVFSSKQVVDGGEVMMVLEMLALDGHGTGMGRALGKVPGVRYLAGWSTKDRVGTRFRCWKVRGDGFVRR